MAKLRESIKKNQRSPGEERPRRKARRKETRRKGGRGGGVSGWVGGWSGWWGRRGLGGAVLARAPSVAGGPAWRAHHGRSALLRRSPRGMRFVTVSTTTTTTTKRKKTTVFPSSFALGCRLTTTMAPLLLLLVSVAASVATGESAVFVCLFLVTGAGRCRRRHICILICIPAPEMESQRSLLIGRRPTAQSAAGHSISMRGPKEKKNKKTKEKRKRIRPVCECVCVRVCVCVSRQIKLQLTLSHRIGGEAHNESPSSSRT